MYGIGLTNLNAKKSILNRKLDVLKYLYFIDNQKTNVKC